MHRALAADASDPAFAPEPFTRLYQRTLYQSMRNLTGRICARLSSGRHEQSDPLRELAAAFLSRQEEVVQRFKTILDRTLDGQTIRCHGNYNLAHLLYTGRNFVVVDFGGDATLGLLERRVKRPPFTDVTAMVRSFDSIAFGSLYGLHHRHAPSSGVVREIDRAALEPWVAAWSNRMAREFVTEYVAHVETANLLPSTLEGDRKSTR